MRCDLSMNPFGWFQIGWSDEVPVGGVGVLYVWHDEQERAPLWTVPDVIQFVHGTTRSPGPQPTAADQHVG